MDEFDSFAFAGEHHGMFADHTTTSHRMHTDFLGGSLANNPLSPVTNSLVVRRRSHFRKDLSNPLCRAARRVLFVPMVHFNHLNIERFAENLSRLAG
jgi:hypothetical protein